MSCYIVTVANECTNGGGREREYIMSEIAEISNFSLHLGKGPQWFYKAKAQQNAGICQFGCKRLRTNNWALAISTIHVE